MESKTNILVTLVGTNPLPSYVVATTLLKEYKITKIILIYSEKNINLGQESTKKFAENVNQLLVKKSQSFTPNITFVSIKDVGEPDSIKKAAEEQLIPKINNVNKIFFDYTSGTKAMSVNLFESLANKFGSKLTPIYLDARSFSIIEEKRSGRDLRKEVHLAIDDIAKLHGYERGNSHSDCFDSRYPKKVERSLEDIIQSPDTAKEYVKWVNENIRKKFLENKKPKKEVKKLLNTYPEHILQIFESKPNENEKISNFISYSSDYLRDIINDGKITNKEKSEIIAAFFKWLDGKWFEDYVFSVINEIKNESENSLMIDKNWESKEDEYGRHFELDVLAVYGYQLFVFSCTTSKNSSLCKEKGFEVFHRTKQIGGDHAKPVLITMLSSNDAQKENTPEGLQEDLRSFTGSATNSIEVIGLEELKRDTLKNRLKKIIFG